MVLTPIIHVLILWGALALAPGLGYPILFGIGVATLIDVFKELRASAKDEPRPLPDVPHLFAAVLFVGTLALGIAGTLWISQFVQNEFRLFVLMIAFLSAVPRVITIARSFSAGTRTA